MPGQGTAPSRTFGTGVCIGAEERSQGVYTMTLFI